MYFPPIDFNSLAIWLPIVLLVALLGVSLSLIWRQQSTSAGRKWLKTSLHLLLGLTLLGLITEPRWRTELPAGCLLLVADNVPGDVLAQVRDSLHIREVVRASRFKGATDTVVLLGHQFSDALLAKLARQVVAWVPYDAPNQLQALAWQGVVQLGEAQVVTGQLTTTGTQPLRLRFGQRTLDSLRVSGPNQPFQLRYPIFSQGRSSVTLWLGDSPIDTLRFVARPSARLRVRFVQDAPDFETRALAEWLGQQGHQVELTNTLSKGIGNTLTLNVPSQSATAPPDLVITDPANVNNALVKKALTAGNAVLVINLLRPETDLTTTNRALGTRWQVRRIPGKDSVRVRESLTALPFRFLPSPLTLPVGTYPIAVQPTAAGGRAAISLLTETFPLRLSGDSTAYEQLWLSVLARLQPTTTNNITYEAPLFQHQPTYLILNNPTANPTQAGQASPGFLRLGTDTVALQPAPLNDRSWVGLVRPSQPGWQPLQDTLAGYVYDANPAEAGLADLAHRKKIAAMVRVHRRYDLLRPGTARFIETDVPDWVWFIALLLLLTAIWAEPKLA